MECNEGSEVFGSRCGSSGDRKITLWANSVHQAILIPITPFLMTRIVAKMEIIYALFQFSTDYDELRNTKTERW